MKQFKISEALLFELLTYLDKKPHGEVKIIVSELSRVEEIKETPVEKVD